MTGLHFHVEQKTWIHAETYRELNQRAMASGTTVAKVLAQIADDAVRNAKHEAQPVRRHVRMTPELIKQAAALYRTGNTWMEISRRLGVSRSTLQNYKTRIVNDRSSE